MPERFDIGALEPPERLPNGMLRVGANLTRIGVFHYLRGDGTVIRELRTPENVFKPESMKTFRMVPVTNDHPPEQVTAANAKKYAVGSASDNIVRDGDFMRSALMFFEDKAIKDVESGKVEISCGYTCDLDYKPGVWNGEHYDAVQTNIVGNHVAIVEKGRAGPDVRIRLDKADGRMVEKKKDAQMDQVEVTIDGKKFMVSKELAAALEAERAAKKPAEPPMDSAASKADKAEIARVTKERDELKAKLDTAANAKSAKEAEDKIRADERAKVTARMALESKAKSVLGAEWKPEQKTDEAIRLEIVKHFDAETDFSGKSADYIEARIDAEMLRADKENPALAAAREAANGGEPSAAAKAAKSTLVGEEKSRKDMIDASAKRGLEPLKTGRSKK